MTSRPSNAGKTEEKCANKGKKWKKGQSKKLMTLLEISIYWCCH
jgi:hypothetical protein